jgi:beta-N-acetylhexosaminidase
MTGNTSMQAAIYGLSGLTLTAEEKHFLREANPYGFILFARNCESPEQIRSLVLSLKEAVGRDALPVLIDQEGGRVARLKPPHWRAAPPGERFAKIAMSNLSRAEHAVYTNARLIAAELASLGITVNCAPLADIPAPGSHDIIGDRAYGETPEQVIALARQMARGLLSGGVLPVLKHIPGHGRARVDSHEDLPVVTEDLATLEATDFVPFRALKDIPLGMTAHIIYTALDAENCATVSPRAIAYIREKIGYDGLLMSDDLSMKALKGNFRERAEKTLVAGCDLVLHCNGKMEEMVPVAEGAATMTSEAVRRANTAWKMLEDAQPVEWAAELSQYEQLMTG